MVGSGLGAPSIWKVTAPDNELPVNTRSELRIIEIESIWSSAKSIPLELPGAPAKKVAFQGADTTPARPRSGPDAHTDSYRLIDSVCE